MSSVADVQEEKTEEEEGATKNSSPKEGVVADAQAIVTAAAAADTNSTKADKDPADASNESSTIETIAAVAEMVMAEASQVIAAAPSTTDKSSAISEKTTPAESTKPGTATEAQSASGGNPATVDPVVVKDVKLSMADSKGAGEGTSNNVPRFFSKKHGRTIRTLWTKEEDAILLARLRNKTSAEIESINWSSLCAEILPHRDRQALRQHWYRRLDPRRKTGHWTLEEDILLLEKYQEMGASWIKLSRMIGGRSDMDTLNRFKSITRNAGNPENILAAKQAALVAKQQLQGKGEEAPTPDTAEAKKDQKSESTASSTKVATEADQGLSPDSEHVVAAQRVTADLETLSVPIPPFAMLDVPTLDELLPQSTEERKQMEDAVQNSARRYTTGQLNKKWWSVKEDVALMHQLKGKTEEELKRFPWAELAKSFPGRDGKSMRDRYVLRLRPGRKTGEWTEQEIQTLIDLQKQHGNSWAKISKFIPGRTPADVKNRFNSAAMMKRLNPSQKSNAPPLKDLMPQSEKERQTLEEKVDTMRKGSKGSRGQHWTVEEDIVLIHQLQGRSQDELPRGFWKDLAESFPRRSRKAIRDRYFLHLHPDRKFGDWGEEETAKLVALHETHGNSWAKISAEIAGRSTDDVRARFKAIAAQAKRTGGEDKGKKTELNPEKKRTRSSVGRAPKAASTDEGPSTNEAKRMRRSVSSAATRKLRGGRRAGNSEGKETSEKPANSAKDSPNENVHEKEPSKKKISQPGEEVTTEERQGDRSAKRSLKAAVDQPLDEGVSGGGKRAKKSKKIPSGQSPNVSTAKQSEGVSLGAKQSAKLAVKDEEESGKAAAKPLEKEKLKTPPLKIAPSSETGVEGKPNAKPAKQNSTFVDQRPAKSKVKQPKPKVAKAVSEPAATPVTRGASRQSKKNSSTEPETRKTRQRLKTSPSEPAATDPETSSDVAEKTNSLPVKKRGLSKEEKDKKRAVKRSRRSARIAEGGDDQESQAAEMEADEGETKPATLLQNTAAAVARAIGWKRRASSKKHTF